MITRLYTTKEISGMVKAMKRCRALTVDKTNETVAARTKSGKTVFRSLRGPNVQGTSCWITRHEEDLFL